MLRFMAEQCTSPDFELIVAKDEKLKSIYYPFLKKMIVLNIVLSTVISILYKSDFLAPVKEG